RAGPRLGRGARARAECRGTRSEARREPRHARRARSRDAEADASAHLDARRCGRRRVAKQWKDVVARAARSGPRDHRAHLSDAARQRQQRRADQRAGRPPGDALTIQRTSSRGAFPPLPRPAVSSIAITANEVDITSRATPDPGTVIPPQPLHVRFPKSAILTASFATPPRAIELHRIFSKEITTLLGDGGTIAIYDIDTRKLLPKPRQVIAFPATPERRQALTGIINMIGKTGQEMTGLRTVDSGTELVVGFDETSMDHYLKDGSDEARWPANLWAAKIDPKRMVPLL